MKITKDKNEAAVVTEIFVNQLHETVVLLSNGSRLFFHEDRPVRTAQPDSKGDMHHAYLSE